MISENYSIPRIKGFVISLNSVSSISAVILDQYSVYDYRVELNLEGAVSGSLQFHLHEIEYSDLRDQLHFVKRFTQPRRSK